MAKQLKLRRGTTAQHSTFTGASGEVTVDTTKKTLVVHDGTTAGGVPLATAGANTFTADQTINGLRVGKGAGSVSTNTAVGASALAGSNTGNYNTAIGANTVKVNTSGQGLTALGFNALAANTTASDNTALGTSSLQTNTTGASNVGVGGSTIQSNTTGSANVGVGFQALVNNTTASNNTAVGYQAGYSITTGNSNTAVGQNALYSNQTAYNNTAIGLYALYSATGINNTAIGQTSGSAITTGTANTIIGRYSGNQGGLDIRTASNYIVLSDGDGNPRVYWDNVGHLFNYNSCPSDFVATFKNTASTAPYGIDVQYNGVATNNTSSYFYRGYDAVGAVDRFVVRSNGGIANYSGNNVNLSDRREKTNFAPSKSYLDVICAIPVQTYNYIDQNMEEDSGLTLGVVAQDVQAVAPEFVTESNWGTEESPKMRLSIYQTDLQYALMKCIQEQQAIITSQQAAIEQLKADVAALKGGV